MLNVVPVPLAGVARVADRLAVDAPRALGFRSARPLDHGSPRLPPVSERRSLARLCLDQSPLLPLVSERRNGSSAIIPVHLRHRPMSVPRSASTDVYTSYAANAAAPSTTSASTVITVAMYVNVLRISARVFSAGPNANRAIRCLRTPVGSSPTPTTRPIRCSLIAHPPSHPRPVMPGNPHMARPIRLDHHLVPGTQHPLDVPVRGRRNMRTRDRPRRCRRRPRHHPHPVTEPHRKPHDPLRARPTCPRHPDRPTRPVRRAPLQVLRPDRPAGHIHAACTSRRCSIADNINSTRLASPSGSPYDVRSHGQAGKPGQRNTRSALPSLRQNANTCHSCSAAPRRCSCATAPTSSRAAAAANTRPTIASNVSRFQPPPNSHACSSTSTTTSRSRLTSGSPENRPDAAAPAYARRTSARPAAHPTRHTPTPAGRSARRSRPRAADAPPPTPRSAARPSSQHHVRVEVRLVDVPHHDVHPERIHRIAAF